MTKIPIGLVLVIVILGVSNLLASSLVGLGDAEALYYCYGRHPSLSYLDHPPLIGWLLFVTTSIGGPSVLAVRIVSFTTTALCVLFTYFLALEVFGRRAALWSVLLLGATPIFSIGMVAATPDAPLATLWPLFTWQLFLAGKDQRSGFWSNFGRPVFLGLILGLAFLSKYTGAALVLTVTLALASKPYRNWTRRPGFWVGALVAAIVSLPVFIWNYQNDFAGVLHRLVWTQGNSGLSLRNLGALLGGQLLYVGPLMLVLMFWAAWRLWKKRRGNHGASLLLMASVPALLSTYLLTLWSDVAEPHWPAVAYMPLFAAAGGLVVELEGRASKMAKYAVAYGLFALVALHVVVLTPLLPSVTPVDSYTREYDLGNELRGWPEVAKAIREENTDNRPVVAAFYTQCSQLFFALGEIDDPPVRCLSDEIDDFDLWYPEFNPGTSPIMFVTDNRFDFDTSKLLPDFELEHPPVKVQIHRAGLCVREFEILSLRHGHNTPK